MNINRIFIVLSFLSFFSDFSCVKKPLITGTQRVVEASHPSKPDWIQSPAKETAELIYSVGVRTGAISLEGGETDARMNAARKILERYFGLKTIVEYEKVRRTFETDYLDSMKARGGGEIFGTKTKGVYWEKYENLEASRVSYNYNIWVLLEVKKSDIEQALDRVVKRRSESIRVVRMGLKELSEKAGVDALKEISEYENMLKEFEDDPEAKPLLIELAQKRREIESREKSIAVYISEKDLNGREAGFARNMVHDILRKYSFNIKELKEKPNNIVGIKGISGKDGVAYLLLVEIETEPSSETSGYFVFAYANGRMTLYQVSSGKTVLSYEVNEKGAGADMKKAETGALKIAGKIISQKLEDTLKELW